MFTIAALNPLIVPLLTCLELSDGGEHQAAVIVQVTAPYVSGHTS